MGRRRNERQGDKPVTADHSAAPLPATPSATPPESASKPQPGSPADSVARLVPSTTPGTANRPGVADARGPQAPAVPPPADRHGPPRPATTLHGISHLRAVMNLVDADLDQLCEDAALELEDWHRRARYPHRYYR